MITPEQIEAIRQDMRVRKLTKQNKQQKRNQLVLERLIAFSNDDKESATYLAEALDDILDELCMDDFFGTECQMDPRGDDRNGSWSMKKVEGIDK